MFRFDGKKDPERRKALEEGERVGLGVETETDETAPLTFDFIEYRKMTTTFAARMDEAFEVDTLEGLHQGKAGDYLAVGQAGELYPIDAAVFAATYERVNE